MADYTQGVNYAAKYSPLVDERFKIGPLTSGMVNNNYDWLGVQTVKVYSIPTATMGNYTVSGTARYGSAAELANSVQELQVTQDRAFTFTIDRKNQQDTMGVMDAAAALRRQVDEVILAELDTYRIAAFVSGAKAAHIINDSAVTKSNVYEKFLLGQEKLDDAKVPQGGRFAICTPAFFNFLKQDEAFVKRGDMATQIGITGVIGECDGVYFIKAPTSYFPTGTQCIITNNMVMVSPIKLEDYKIHIDPPGINGALVEGRIRYDAFILEMKQDAIAVIQNPGSGETGESA